MLQQMVIKLTKADKEFWTTFAQKLHCKDTTEFVRKLTIIMRTTPINEFREWFYTRLAKAEGEPEAPVNRILQTVLAYAIKDGATEIHIEPRRFDEPTQWEYKGTPFEVNPKGGVAMLILYRINGELQEQMKVPRYVHEPLVSLIKGRSDLWEQDVPQQGMLRVELDDKSYRWPVAIAPGELGEKIVIQVKL